jgi:hypothetical protein
MIRAAGHLVGRRLALVALALSLTIQSKFHYFFREWVAWR